MTDGPESDGSIQNGDRRRALSPVLGLDEFRPLSSAVTVEFAAHSSPGARPNNEDHYLILRLSRSQEIVTTSLPQSDVLSRFDEHGYAMLIADGIGGTGTGAVASRVALSTLAHLAMHYGRWNVRVDGRTAAEIIERAEWYYRRVNDAVLERGKESPHLAGMATTLTATYSAGDDLFLAHVGHSRAYIFRDGELTQLTSDDTVANRLTQTPSRPMPVDRATEDLKHILTDTIGGVSARPLVQAAHFRIWDGDCVLLCTDGLIGQVGDERIAEVLTLRRRLDDQCRMLVDLALQGGGRDNVTVLLAQYRVPRH
jgi:PPM family protein phosphatase